MKRYNTWQPVYRSANTDPRTVWAVFGFAVFLAVAAHLWLGHHGMWTDMWKIVWAGVPIWFVLLAALAYGFVWWKCNENFSRLELALYCLAVPFFAYPGTALGYYWLTDLNDVEVWAGQAVQAEYVEQYYTISRDKDGKETRTYYGPYYYLHTNNGERDRQDIGSEEWENVKELWGGRQRVTSELNSQSHGIHFIYKISWDQQRHTRLFTATEHRWVNLIKASDSILKVHGAIKGWEKYLAPYPRVTRGNFGPIELNRVVQAGITLNSGFVNDVNEVLREQLAQIGRARECNVIVYATSASAAMFPALKEYWVLGHNNDIVVVIGTEDGKTITWAEVMCHVDEGYTPFIGSLTARIYNLKTLNSGRRFAQEICAQIQASGKEGYKRLPREKLEHLIPDVRLPLWAGLVIVVVSGLWLTPTVWLFIHD